MAARHKAQLPALAPEPADALAHSVLEEALLKRPALILPDPVVVLLVAASHQGDGAPAGQAGAGSCVLDLPGHRPEAPLPAARRARVQAQFGGTAALRGSQQLDTVLPARRSCPYVIRTRCGNGGICGDRYYTR
jgi:hypothetical protein